jgi:hypothetical protein
VLKAAGRVDGQPKCAIAQRLLEITRVSHVEPDAEGLWWADTGPVDGPVLGPFKNRTEALRAERGWLVGRGESVD